MTTRPVVCSASLVVGARFACVPCRVRQIAERCARCNGPTVDLTTAAGERALASLAATQPVPTRNVAFERGTSPVTQAFVWSLAAVGGAMGAVLSRRIPTYGFIDQNLLAALIGVGGFVAGRLVASIVLAVANVAMQVAGFVAWLLSHTLLSLATRAGRGPYPFAGMFDALGIHGRNALRVPFGDPRETPRRAPLGPVLAPLEPVVNSAPGAGETPMRAREGTLAIDGDVTLGRFTGALVGIEGRTHGTDIADAAVAPFRLRVAGEEDTVVRVERGVVRFAPRPDAFEIAAGLPRAWGVRNGHAQQSPVNVWIARDGARVRIEGGAIDADGAWVGTVDVPLVVTVLDAVS